MATTKRLEEILAISPGIRGEIEDFAKSDAEVLLPKKSDEGGAS